MDLLFNDQEMSDESQNDFHEEFKPSGQIDTVDCGRKIKFHGSIFNQGARKFIHENRVFHNKILETNNKQYTVWNLGTRNTQPGLKVVPNGELTREDGMRYVNPYCEVEIQNQQNLNMKFVKPGQSYPLPDGQGPKI